MLKDKLGITLGGEVTGKGKASWTFLELVMFWFNWLLVITVCSVCENSGIHQDITLTGVAQWIASGAANRKVTGSIPSQGTLLGLQARFPVGGM